VASFSGEMDRLISYVTLIVLASSMSKRWV